MLIPSPLGRHKDSLHLGLSWVETCKFPAFESYHLFGGLGLSECCLPHPPMAPGQPRRGVQRPIPEDQTEAVLFREGQ
jgi:hypothetical protein